MSDPTEEKRFWIYVEDALIVLAIPVLWLKICNIGGEFTNWALFITLVVMAVVFFRRISRIRRRTGD
ncbi:MAG: hypothetical protein GXP25_02130 [Planctomycetes bacterium]|nr:hypothetical protein [Planctomycetota bacterium]